MDARGGTGDVEPTYTRPPTLDDLRLICTYLGDEGAKFVVIGGMAMNHYGAMRATHDIDLLVESSEENVSRVLRALARLPDHAAAGAQPGDVRRVPHGVGARAVGRKDGRVSSPGAA